MVSRAAENQSARNVPSKSLLLCCCFVSSWIIYVLWNDIEEDGDYFWLFLLAMKIPAVYLLLVLFLMGWNERLGPTKAHLPSTAQRKRTR